MAERDKTITMTSHLHFASFINTRQLLPCRSRHIPWTHHCEEEGAKYVLVIKFVMEITHERNSRTEVGTVLYYLLNKRR